MQSCGTKYTLKRTFFRGKPCVRWLRVLLLTSASDPESTVFGVTSKVGLVGDFANTELANIRTKQICLGPLSLEHEPHKGRDLSFVTLVSSAPKDNQCWIHRWGSITIC